MTIRKFNHDLSDKPFDIDRIKDQIDSLSQENNSTQKAIAHLRADLKEEFIQLKKILLKGGIAN